MHAGDNVRTSFPDSRTEKLIIRSDGPAADWISLIHFAFLHTNEKVKNE